MCGKFRQAILEFVSGVIYIYTHYIKMYVNIYIQMVKPMVPQEFFYQKWLRVVEEPAPATGPTALIQAAGPMLFTYQPKDTLRSMPRGPTWLGGSPLGSKDPAGIQGCHGVHLAAMAARLREVSQNRLSFAYHGCWLKVSSSSFSA